jgi:hypothetical protein
MPLTEEKLVSTVSDLLQLDTTVIKEADDAKIDSLITDFKNSHKIFKTDEFDRLLTNTKTEYIQELVATKDQLPKPLYDRVKRDALSAQEKKIAEKYQISDYEGSEDLIEKIVIKNKNGAPETEKDTEIQRLKQLVKDTEKEYLTKLEEANGKTKTFIVSEKLRTDLHSIELEATDDNALNEMRGIILTNFNSKYNVSVENEKFIVSDKSGQVLKDKVGDPRPLSEVLRESIPSFIKVKQSQGGRGDFSSQNSSGLTAIKTKDEYDKLRRERNIKPNSPEDLALFLEVKKANPEFKL